MTTGEKDPFRLVGQTLDGRFHVQSVVATGGFGTVYAATHILLQNRIALKVLRVPPEAGSNDRNHIVEAFRNEALALAKLAHPSIVRALDFGVSQVPTGEWVPWMALEWIEGFTLRDELRGRLGGRGRSPHEALHALRPVFDALGYAHKAGLAHRDVKPANLMYDTRSQMVKVLDFGIAKVMSPEEEAGTGQTRTRAQFRAYSPMYAAPEQIVATRTGPWTDVHAMGLILTEMLTDRAAYRVGTPQMLMAQALAPIRPSPAAMGFDVGEWEAVIQRALAVAPRDRFADAHQFLAALESSMARASVLGNRAAVDTSAEQTHWMGSSSPNPDTHVTGDPHVSNRPPAQPVTTRKPQIEATDTTRGRRPKPSFALRAALIAFAAFGGAAATWIAFRRPTVGTSITDAAAALAPARSTRNTTPAPPTPAAAPAPVPPPGPPAAPTPAAAPAIEPGAALPAPASIAANPPAAHSHHHGHARSDSARTRDLGHEALVPLE